MSARILIACQLAFMLLFCAPIAGSAEEVSHLFTFDYPMSYADDVVPWSDTATQGWLIEDGGNPGKALVISGETYSKRRSYEIRTIQFNHQPNTPVKISFDIKNASLPDGAFFMVRHFDGYCGGQAFFRVVDDKLAPFPAPLYDSRKTPARGWRRIQFTTPPLKHTTVTFALIAQQPYQKPAVEDATVPAEEPKYIKVMLDNLKIGVTPLGKLMDTGFDWHANYGSSTAEFRYNTMAADADWCDFADQEDVVTPDGIIHYTLFQYRDTTLQKNPATRHQVIHEQHTLGAGGFSTIHLQRWTAGSLSAASWGVRQTVAYSALGLAPGKKARIRVTMKVSNLDHDFHEITSVQLGIDPNGGVITQKAIWSKPDHINIRTHATGWSTPVIEFDRPTGSAAFTIYFRHLDGGTAPPRDQSYPAPPREVQSTGTPSACEAFADWVAVEVVK